MTTPFSPENLTPTWVKATAILKGDSPGHPFRGNQYKDAGEVVDAMKGIARHTIVGSQNAANLHNLAVDHHMAESDYHDQQEDKALNATTKRGLSSTERAWLKDKARLHAEASTAHYNAGQLHLDAGDAMQEYSRGSYFQDPNEPLVLSNSAIKATERALAASKRAEQDD
jgi:hypothetical protein